MLTIKKRGGSLLRISRYLRDIVLSVKWKSNINCAKKIDEKTTILGEVFR